MAESGSSVRRVYLINGRNQRRPRGGMVDTKDLKSVES